VKRELSLTLISTLFITGSALAAVPPRKVVVDRLGSIRSQVLSIESGLIDGLKGQKETQANAKKIQKLMALQKEERELAQARLKELEKTVQELESRRAVLNSKVKSQGQSIRGLLAGLERAIREKDAGISTDAANGAATTAERERLEHLEAPRRRVLANLVERGLKEIVAYRIDLADAERLEARIQDERQHLVYLSQDMKEQESILELNRQLQLELLTKNRSERVKQLEAYRRLKASEAHLERLLTEFNARIELEKIQETEKQAARAQARLMNQGAFSRLKGTLALPVAGKVTSGFGRAFDPKTQLHIFKKGIDISSGSHSAVKAVSAGKVVYSGELPEYGRVTILDHGDHFYSLYAQLGSLARATGDSVTGGEALGTSDERGTPVYFEIRSRNIPVNPLQWISN
jgi:septal ring factor EnvC (AmiA/AmiB activator)